MDTKSLEALGLEKEVIDKIMADYGKDIQKEQQKITKATEERDNLQKQLEDVQEKLKAFDGVDVETLTEQISTLTKDLADKEKDYKEKLSERDFDDMLKNKLSNEKFSSDYAKNGVIAEIKAKGLKLGKDGILGLDDALKEIKESQPNAFATDNTVNGTPPVGTEAVPKETLQADINKILGIKGVE